MRRPLPLARRTAIAWLAGKAGPASAHAAARTVYEGRPGRRADTDRGPAPELERNPALRRSHPTYAHLVASGEFEGLAHDLYGPLVACTNAALESARAAGNARDDNGSDGETGTGAA